MEKFVNKSINMKDFQNVYNSFTPNKVEFTGGYMKISDLIRNTRFVKKTKKTKKGGGVEEAGARDNFFNLIGPMGDATSTNIISELNQKSFDFPKVVNSQRSFI